MGKRGVVIAGLAGGSGKSVVAVGITAALTRQGLRVVPFKKGPDYIDAGWLQLAAGRKCYNLDPYLMSQAAIVDSFVRRSAMADMVIVEGNRGLFDGVNVDGGYSTADLALTLDLPVVLVVDCTKTTRTVAAMVLGCQKFDERLKIQGVILNQIATDRQRLLITEAVEKYTGVTVLGVVPRLKRDIFPMRHLGMVPHQEYDNSREALAYLAELVAGNVDLEKFSDVMAPLPQTFAGGGAGEPPVPPVVRLGVLQDAAFQFYYSENLEALEQAGAQLVYINAMRDAALPDIDGLYIGGGFPETGARELAANAGFRHSVKRAADNGLPIYAECGGLIYLGTSIVLDGEEFPLAGVFPVRFAMAKKPQAHGYTTFRVKRQNAFYAVGEQIKGHEFRYSKVIEWRGHVDQLALTMERGTGFQDGCDGLIHNNVLALYTHVHAEGTPQWATNFVDRCRRRAKGEE